MNRVGDGMDKLLEHHIRDTERRFDEVREDLGGISKKLTDVQEFKVQMIINARWVSLVVSAVCGLVTMAVTTFVSVKYK